MLLEEASKIYTSLNNYLASLPTEDPNIHDRNALALADQLAIASLHDKNKVGAVIYNRSRIIASGVNSNKTHPIQARWNKFSCRLHAEIAALINALKTKEFNANEVTIAISRIRKGAPLPSYPCNKGCWPALEHAGIKRLVCYLFSGKPILIKIP